MFIEDAILYVLHIMYADVWGHWLDTFRTHQCQLFPVLGLNQCLPVAFWTVLIIFNSQSPWRILGLSDIMQSLTNNQVTWDVNSFKDCPSSATDYDYMVNGYQP